MIGRILDFYFRFAVKIDYIIGMIILAVLNCFVKKGFVTIPSNQQVLDYASEATTVLLTLAGFILTFLTVLITFRMGSSSNSGELSIMDRFCKSPLYGETTSQLKNCVKSLVFLTLIIYILRFINVFGIWILYYWIILSVIILLLTILRSLFILDNILKFHIN